MNTFGVDWTDALCEGSERLGVHVAWVLAVLALESGFDPCARNRSGARGLWQRMPVAGMPYAETDPVRQLRDAFAFWRAMVVAFDVGRLSSREALYCLNLAPARLRGGCYDDDTALYAAPSRAYEQNAAAFGLDPRDTRGVIRMRHLAHGLDAAIARCRGRYDAELEATLESDTHPARDYAPNIQPAAVIDRSRLT